MAELPDVNIVFNGDIKQFEQAMSKVLADLKKVEGETKKTGEAHKEMSAKTIAAGAAMGAVVTELAHKAVDFAKEFVTSFSDVGGEVRKLQRTLGGTPEDMSRLRFAAEEVGVSVDTLGRGMRILSTHITKNDAQAKSLGVSFRDANGHLLPSTQIVQNLADKFSKMPNGLEKTALAVKAFGRSGTEMIPILNLGAKGLEDMYKNSDKLGLTMSGKDLAAAKDFTMKQRELKAAIQGAQLAIGRQLVPQISAMINLIIEKVIPVVQSFINGLTGKNGMTGALSESGRQAAAWGNLLRTIFADMVKYKDLLLVIAGIMAVMWTASKISAGLTAVIAGITAIATAWEAVTVAAGTAAVAEDVASGGTIGVAQALAATAAIALVAGIGAKVYSSVKNYKPPTTYAQRTGGENSGAGGSTPVTTDAGGYDTSALTDATKGASSARTDKVKDYIKQIEATRAGMMADFKSSYASATNATERLNVVKATEKSYDAVMKAAVAEEKATRGTKNHELALKELNKVKITYASLLTNEHKLEKQIDDAKAKATKLAKEQADALAKANAELEQQLRLMNASMSASNSWLAAQTRTAGPTASNAGGFINVPVIIDGQTVFRATQRYSLLNDRRNPTNGLSISGSTI